MRYAITYLCLECEEIFDDPAELEAHHKEKHSPVPHQ